MTSDKSDFSADFSRTTRVEDRDEKTSLARKCAKNDKKENRVNIDLSIPCLPRRRIMEETIFCPKMTDKMRFFNCKMMLKIRGAKVLADKRNLAAWYFIHFINDVRLKTDY